MELDARHASVVGCYQGALVWYGVLFGDSPAKVTFVPAGITADYASFLKAIAAQTVAGATAVKP